MDNQMADKLREKGRYTRVAVNSEPKPNKKWVNAKDPGKVNSGVVPGDKKNKDREKKRRMRYIDKSGGLQCHAPEII